MKAGARGNGLKQWMASLLCVLAFALAAMAQDTDEQGVPTLRAYANRIQVPTLVLSESRGPMARVAEDRFYVSLDGGPKFRVNHAWLEGNDPISLAVLLDLTQRDAGMMQTMDDAIAGLAAGSLHAEDRVWVYSLGCNLVRTKEGIPAEAALLKNAVDLSLQQWDTWKHDRNKSDCTMQWHLRDSIAEIVAQLAKQPGRRVLLVVTDGQDRGSKMSWNAVRITAQANAVAVFGMVQPRDEFPHVGMALNRVFVPERMFNSLCELSGGMVLAANQTALEAKLMEFVTMVRGRCIVEFPRPINGVAGFHDMDISIAGARNAFIRPAGDAMPREDPAISKDPNTVPEDPANAPQYGNRKVLAPR